MEIQMFLILQNIDNISEWVRETEYGLLYCNAVAFWMAAFYNKNCNRKRNRTW